MIARLEVTRGSLTEYPLAEKVCGGWQNGVMFYPDAEVTKVTPLIFRNETPTDDEQEALVKRLEDEVEYRVRTAVALHKGGHDHEEQVRQGWASVRFLAAGFRRTEAAPTDDEREALRIAELDARQAAYRKEREDWFVDHEAEPEIATNAFFRGWDAAVGGGFRRSEVPEPSTECPQPCVHLSQHDAREGRTCAEHPCTCPGPQGEPSDAQVEDAWWKAQGAGQLPRTPGPSNRQAFEVGYRAALRAAGGVR